LGGGWLDVANYSGMNAVLDAGLYHGYAQPRACVQAALAKHEWRLEVMVVARQK
jgi:hypothetical protein